MTKKSSRDKESIPEWPATEQAVGDESWWEDLAEAGEQPPSAEELAAAQRFANLTDSWLAPHQEPGSEASGHTLPAELPEELPEEWEELASFGLLMRHVASPPALSEESKQRIAEELLALPTVAVVQDAVVQESAAASGLWERLQAGWQRLFFRPAWAAFALALLCVGSWGLYQGIQSSGPLLSSRSWRYSQDLPGQHLFGGTLAKPSQRNPFQHTRSASERLDDVTEQLGRWQRKHWLQQTRQRLYRGT